MMYLIFGVVCALMFLIGMIGAFVAKKGKRTAAVMFSVLFFAAGVFCAFAYYNGMGNTVKRPKEIAEYCSDGVNELINATKLEFKNVSDSMYEANGVSLYVSNEQIVYLDLSAEEYMVCGFSGNFSKENTVYKGEKTLKDFDEVLNTAGFTEISHEYAESEFLKYDEFDMCVYDSKGRMLAFTFDENGNGRRIRYFPHPEFTEKFVNSTECFNENISGFLSETKNLNLTERKNLYEKDIGKRVVWQLKAIENSDDFILAEKNGTEFKIYPLPQYKSRSALPEKDEYIEVVGLFGGYSEAWSVTNAAVKRHINVSESNSEIIGTYKNTSSEITVKEEDGRLRLTGMSNYGAYTVDGYVEKINEITYFYDGSEGDFYITITDSGVEITTDTLKSFEGEYILKE